MFSLVNDWFVSALSSNIIYCEGDINFRDHLTIIFIGQEDWRRQAVSKNYSIFSPVIESTSVVLYFTFLCLNSTKNERYQIQALKLISDKPFSSNPDSKRFLFSFFRIKRVSRLGGRKIEEERLVTSSNKNLIL